MKPKAPARNRHAPAPHRGVLTALIITYAFTLAGIAFFMSRGRSGSQWKHLWTAWTRMPEQHPSVRLPVRLPALPPPPALRPASRVFVWHPSPPSRSQPQRTARPRVHQPTQARLARRSMHRATQVRTARRPSQPLHQLKILLAPPRDPVVTWAHPPDPTLPPECRPPHPVVARQY
jgi:hypothetical protein